MNKSKEVAVLVLLGLVACIFCETCPSNESIFPCTCTEENGHIFLDCYPKSSSNTLEELRRALNNLMGKTNVYMTLRSYNIKRIPSTIFSGMDIKMLVFSDCSIEAMADENGGPAFVGLENNLEVLEIKSSLDMGYVETAPATFHHLHRLRIMDIGGNSFRTVGNDWFARGPASLRTLYFYNNDVINDLGNQVFAGLSNIRELHVYNIGLNRIYRTMFPNPATNLEILNLDGNGIETFPEDMFTNMPSLKRVSLDRNAIQRLDERTWQPVWQTLTEVSLQLNPFYCDSHINWMFSVQRPGKLYATCEYPSEKKGKSLSKLIDEKE